VTRVSSSTHVVVIPSYDTGALVYDTVRAARAAWSPVWVVVDGSRDGTAEGLRAMAAGDPGLRVEVLPRNVGKGAAVLHGLEGARKAGFTHALTMDSDGQHPAELIAAFMAASAAQPGAMILGRPVFDASAPLLRVRGRRISNAWTNLETLGAGIADSLYGFRVYPIAPLIEIMRGQTWMRRFDFDTEAVVRLAWRGVTPINIDAPVKYLRAEEGGVSHFRYGRDNALLSWMHLRLLFGFAIRLPMLAARRLTGRPPFGTPRAIVSGAVATAPNETLSADPLRSSRH
jgi:glycosyltransferase involved in cell wall biosynthesis